MFKRKTRDPSIPLPPPTTSKDFRDIASTEELSEPCRKRFCRYIYDKEKNLYCGRSCTSWISIIAYSILYLTFLCTYTLLFLYGSLSLIKFMDKYESVDKIELMTYSKQGIGLSATPTSVNTLPIISYKAYTDDDKQYVDELDSFFKRRKRSSDLGPCGSSPFGYWNEPCIIIRINKQIGWSAKPLSNDTNDIPQDVKNWMKTDQKLWLHCHGFHSYDKEHIGRITYYPDPPGFDPALYPINMTDDTPLVAVQIRDFTFGISLAVECTLYYEGGSSSVAFLLYVTPKRKVILSV
ncbi:probable sodium/potassium-transporting ATPase subunit beta-3 [Pieris napi]|uniref:probable sodium/potassium-transporting ATPase subunit beta-3 n=1 Tax=Pieris napi TaxID=78633 RepID=UPI001FBA4E75|nr:probable sodium/potassium-transporting ATPase subunit beta-3 [Pieris napi]